MGAQSDAQPRIAPPSSSVFMLFWRPSFFATEQGKIHFQILLQSSAARSVEALQSSTGGDLRLRAPDPAFLAEQVLDCFGTLLALSTQLCRYVSGLQFPLIYLWGTQYQTNAAGPGHLQPQ